jgi:hypothetical protein
MSSSYHLETNRPSAHSNKTVIQCLHYHVKWNQTGWAAALPCVHFNLMNTINISASFSPFQLCMGHFPHLIPPLETQTITDLSTDLSSKMAAAVQLIEQL